MCHKTLTMIVLPMKNLLVIALFLYSTSALDEEFVEAFLTKLQDVAQVCAEETHATDDDIAELMERKIPSSHEGKCMIFCFQRNFGTMKEDGSIDKVGTILALDALRQQDFELYKKVLELCVICSETVKLAEDPCDTATSLMICVKEEAGKLGLDESVLG